MLGKITSMLMRITTEIKQYCLFIFNFKICIYVVTFFHVEVFHLLHAMGVYQINHIWSAQIKIRMYSTDTAFFTWEWDRN